MSKITSGSLEYLVTFLILEVIIRSLRGNDHGTFEQHELDKGNFDVQSHLSF